MVIAKIINKNSEDYNKEFKIRRMNYDQVVVNYPSSKGINVFINDDIEFITENEIDEFLMKYKDFLKIKLNRGISVVLYKAILEAMELQLNIQFNSLNLLRDKYSVNKRGVWEKDIIAVINDNMPIRISASGQNFKKIGFNISLQQISKEEFLNICAFEIEKVQKEIKEKELILARYGMAMKNIDKEFNGSKLLK